MMSVMPFHLSRGLVAGVLLAAPLSPAMLPSRLAHAQVVAGPVAPIQSLYSALARIQRQGGSVPFEQRAAGLAPSVEQAFDLPTVLRTSVGLRYASLPDAQKQQLLQVFRDFTVARYVSNFTSDADDTLQVQPVARPSPYGTDQIVQTTIGSSSGSPTKVDYVMRRTSQGWRAIDVLLDGHISQVAVQRSDFGSTLTTGDATPLIDSLKKKIQSFSET